MNKKNKDGDEKQQTRLTQTNNLYFRCWWKMRRRTLSTEGCGEGNNVNNTELPQSQQQVELHRSYSEETPTGVITATRKQQHQKDVIGLNRTATTHPGHRHTRSSPASFFTKKIVISKDGRPVYAHEQQQQYDAKEADSGCTIVTNRYFSCCATTTNTI